MNYSELIGEMCYVEYVTSGLLDYKKWKEQDYFTMKKRGVVINGTLGVLVMRLEEDESILRVNDEYIKYFKTIQKGAK